MNLHTSRIGKLLPVCLANYRRRRDHISEPHESNMLLNQLIPARSITCRRRPTDPWFDAYCRAAKRLTRRLERAYAAARRRHNTNVGHTAVSSATSAVGDSSAGCDAVVASCAAWYDQRRAYRRLRHQKYRDFWTQRRSSPRQLILRGFGDQWINYLAVVALLWRRPLMWRPPTSFFADKVAEVYVHLPTTRRRQHTLTLHPGHYWIAATKSKLDLFQSKRDAYWLERVGVDGQTNRLWRTLSDVLGRSN